MRYANVPQLNPVEHRGMQPDPAPKPVPAGPFLTVVRRVLILFAIPLAWLLLCAMLWYAAPRAGHMPRVGSIIRAHYPNLVYPLKIALLVCWFAALALIIVEFSRKWEAAAGRKGSRWISPIIGGLMVLSAAAALIHPRFIPWALNTVALGGLLLLLRGLLVKRTKAAVWSALTLLLLPMPLMWVNLNAIWPMWQDRAQLRLASGETYHLQSYQVLQGRTQAITQELSRGPLFLSTRVLALASGESHVCLVRPRGAVGYDLVPSAEGAPWLRLVSSQDAQWIVAIQLISLGDPATQACGATVAYDLRSNQAYGFSNLQELSPFILIGPHDDLNRADVAALLRVMRPDSSYWEVVAAWDALARESNNPNPHVRELVERAYDRWEMFEGAASRRPR